MSFDKRADTWDASDRRQALAEAVAQAIRERFSLTPKMHLMDFGAGTGLLARRLLPNVSTITAVDTSERMLEKLREAVPGPGKIETVLGDVTAYECPGCFDGIVSTMTMHHIRDTAALLRHLRSMLKPGGFLAVADLMPEDGTFHDHGNEGVHHFGFEEEALCKMAYEAGFSNVAYHHIHTVKKGNRREYGIFLLSATRPRNH
jgi:cyclopropane fatty-acyl-phospholipid synthase-like methyltransferase